MSKIKIFLLDLQNCAELWHSVEIFHQQQAKKCPATDSFAYSSGLTTMQPVWSHREREKSLFFKAIITSGTVLQNYINTKR